ncbi:MAG: histidine kinase [Actinoplanes sp.]
MQVDQFKLMHWLNARKYTAAQLAELAGVPSRSVDALLRGDGADVPAAEVAAVVAALRIEPGQLSRAEHSAASVLLQSGRALRDSRRSIQRDGIHFYNYYTMAAAPGRVAPVILDILCPPDRLPALNNGHLEPAITVNLGPGDIHGRWGEELTPDTWHVLAANTGPDAWITGDSYVEPSYCPHTYSLASGRPARIVSYTAQSNLAALADEVNGWPDGAFAACLDRLGAGLPPADLLDLLLARRGYDRPSLCAAIRTTPQALAATLADPFADLATIRAVGDLLGVDYRLLLPAAPRHDRAGKTHQSIDGARRSRRGFGPYEMATMASAPQLPDLTGLFMRVDIERPADGIDLVEPGECHYLIATGTAAVEWQEPTGETGTALLDTDSSVWVAPFVRHRWSGHASLLKFGSGAHLGYLDLLELSNTFAAASTLRRSRHDLAGWGYDT